MNKINSLNSSSFKSRIENPTFIAFVVVILIWIGTSVFIPGFRSLAHNISFVQTSAYLGFLAVGQAVCIISGGFDLSISSVFTLSSVVASFCLQIGMNTGMAILLAILASFAVGIVNATGITFLRIPPIIMTLATVSLIEGVLLLKTNGTPPSGISETMMMLSKGELIPKIPNVILIYILFMAIMIWFMSFSKFGRQIYALGTNEYVAHLSGTSVNKLKYMIYCVSAVCGGIGGVLYLGYMGNTYLTIGAPFQMFTVAATVIGGISISGGKGNFVGIIAGTFLMTLIQDVLAVAKISSAGRELFQGILILIVILAYGREKLQK